jgi:hypothetical protein
MSRRDYYARERARAIREYRRLNSLLAQCITGKLSLTEGQFIRIDEQQRRLALEYNLLRD